MVNVVLLARLEAKPGKEVEVANLLTSALPLANAEPATTVWFALKMGRLPFGIFDALPDEAGRQAHIAGQIAATPMAKAPELLAEPPTIETCRGVGGEVVDARRPASGTRESLESNV